MEYSKDKQEVMAYLKINPDATRFDIEMCCNLGPNVVGRIMKKLNL